MVRRMAVDGFPRHAFWRDVHVHGAVELAAPQRPDEPHRIQPVQGRPGCGGAEKGGAPRRHAADDCTQLVAMSSWASSQLTARIRLGATFASAAATPDRDRTDGQDAGPFDADMPFRNGMFVSGPTCTARPSLTVTTRPQIASHTRQNVM